MVVAIIKYKMNFIIKSGLLRNFNLIIARDLIGVAEKALFAVSGFVVIVGLSGMLIALMTSLNERRREMAILRSVGARPVHVFA